MIVCPRFPIGVTNVSADAVAKMMAEVEEYAPFFAQHSVTDY
jgi:hypothetical protein